MLVALDNIDLRPLHPDTTVQLSKAISVTPFVVPHRSEYSETVGFIVEGPSQRALYMPDVDRWWPGCEAIIDSVDVAWVDGTFFSKNELDNRDMTQVLHPPIEESINRFASQSVAFRNKIRFIHLNHTNPALINTSEAVDSIKAAGMSIATHGQRILL